MSLRRHVLETIRRYALMRPGDRVLVAVSGGSDSVALLRLLKELEPSGAVTVAGVVHLNHALRAAANEDEDFCRSLAREMDVPFHSARVDVRARADVDHTSLEDAGHDARYELFDRVAAELGADVTATGHTRDDQAETFLLRLFRGAGPRGLGGIHPRADRIVRPLIELRRDELREYLSAIGQPFREDESNRDLSIPRNRIRHELLPLVEGDFSPGIVDVLARNAAIARQDEDRLNREAIDLLDLIVLDNRVDQLHKESSVELDARALAALHPALAIRVARLALGILAPDRFIGFDHIDRLLELVGGAEARAVSLPGQHAERRKETVVLSREPFRPFLNSFRVSLSIPGEVILRSQGWAISAAAGSGANPRENVDALHAVVGAEELKLPLLVRSRQEGDWFRPLGMGGRGKKLQDYLVDRKVERQRRDALPLVVDSADRIVWVVGESVAEDFRVTGPSQGVIFLKARRLGGQG